MKFSGITCIYYDYTCLAIKVIKNERALYCKEENFLSIERHVIHMNNDYIKYDYTNIHNKRFTSHEEAISAALNLVEKLEKLQLFI